MLIVRNFRLITIVIAVSLSIAGTGLAQEQPPWQVAEAMRQALFHAQTEMLAAASAENPSEHYAAATALVEQATTLYAEALQPQVADADPDADHVVQESLRQAREATLHGQILEFSLARGRLWPSLLGGSYQATLTALKQGDVESAATWLQLREYRQATKVTMVDDISTQTMTRLKANQIGAAEAERIIGADLRDAYFFRLRETLNEVEKNIERGFLTRAVEWAGQGRSYFDILRTDIEMKQGQETARQIATSLDALQAACLAENKAAVATHLAEAHDALANYSPVELTEAEIEKRRQLLYLFTDLIYIEYKDGVRDGQITIPIEYQEAVTFREQAEAVFEELRPVMLADHETETHRYAQLLTEMETIMGDLGPVADIKSRVEEAVSLVETTLAVTQDAANAESSLIVINTLLDDLLVAVKQGRYDDAERSRLEAYAMFENGMEQRLANRAIRMTRQLEGLFWEGTGGQKGLATLLQEEQSAAVVEQNVSLLRLKLGEAQSFLAAGLTGIFALLNSLAIIVREGLEAVLIVGAILGYLRATNAPIRYTVWVYLGVGAAILLSLGTWWAARTVITITVASRELIEGVTSLIAVAVLFYVTNWLFHKVYVIDWLTFVREKVSQAVGSGSALALVGLGFTVVYREGFETVLFYQALLFDTEPTWVWLGFIIGLIIILVIAYAILQLSQRLPLKPFFTGTGLLLLLLAFSLTGKGVRELQEAGVVAASLLSWIPENILLMELFGIFPTTETTLAQAIFMLAILLTFALSWWKGQQNVSAKAANG